VGIMSEILDPVGPAPETRSLSFLVLLFGASAAPIFWLGQTMLSYALTAQACYPGDHPVRISFATNLGTVLILCDAMAFIAALAGAAASWWCWRHVRTVERGAINLRIGAGRVRFLSLWGIFSNLCFLIGIAFNTIATLTVPPCPN
jgi:hypothetical protein